MADATVIRRGATDRRMPRFDSIIPPPIGHRYCVTRADIRLCT